MVCLRNISVDTLHKGDTEDNNNNNNNNNNNSTTNTAPCAKIRKHCGTNKSETTELFLTIIRTT
jgi:hypothetical protein